MNQHRGGRDTMSASASITITPVQVADLLAEGERMPVYVHVIEHPDARLLVDTGMTELHPAVADLDPRLRPLSEQDFDLAGIDIVVNTHLHFDHCGGNHLFAGKPIYVQRRELDDARSEDDYTIREWVEAPGVEYVPVDGELELLPGLRLVPAPGHTRGMQMVVVETGGRPLVVGGDVAVWFGELDEPHTEGQLRVRALDPYTVREWVDFDGATYVEHEGEVEVLPGIRLLPMPGHTDGHQSVLVETGGRPLVVGGDVAVWFGELDEPHTEGQLRVRALEPELVWLAHEHEPWRPQPV